MKVKDRVKRRHNPLEKASNEFIDPKTSKRILDIVKLQQLEDIDQHHHPIDYPGPAIDSDDQVDELNQEEDHELEFDDIVLLLKKNISINIKHIIGNRRGRWRNHGQIHDQRTEKTINPLWHDHEQNQIVKHPHQPRPRHRPTNPQRSKPKNRPSLHKVLYFTIYIPNKS